MEENKEKHVSEDVHQKHLITGRMACRLGKWGFTRCNGHHPSSPRNPPTHCREQLHLGTSILPQSFGLFLSATLQVRYRDASPG